MASLASVQTCLITLYYFHASLFIVSGTLCYSCNDVAEPGRCLTLESCGFHEICYTREYTDGSGRHAYRMGCESQEICNVYHNAMNIFGRRRRDGGDQPKFCFECCRGDRCNINTCSGSNYVSPMYSTARPYLSTWYYETTRPWNQGTTAPWNYGTTAPWNYGTTAPWNHGTTAPWRYATTRPWNYVSTWPPYKGTQSPYATRGIGGWTTYPPWTSFPVQHSDNLMLFKLTCDFNQDMCTWRNSDKDNDDWILHRGPTETAGTGPSSDVSGNGQYVYMKARNPGETTMLESPTVKFSSPVCLHFWYHMYGADVSSLSLLKEDSQGYVTLWKQHGDHGNQWKQGRVQLPVGESYLLTFYAVSGSGYKGDIALDGITAVHSSC